MKRIYKIEQKELLFRGKLFDLVIHRLRWHDGRRSTLQIIKHPGAVGIIPIFENGDIMLIRQFRLPAGGEIYEIPAGTLEKGETPLACARRELVEETGYMAKRFIKLARYFSAPGFCTEKMYLYIAEGLVTKKATPDKDEYIRPFRISLKEGLNMIRKGKIIDAKSIIALYMLQDRHGC